MGRKRTRPESFAAAQMSEPVWKLTTSGGEDRAKLFHSATAEGSSVVRRRKDEKSSTGGGGIEGAITRSDQNRSWDITAVIEESKLPGQIEASEVRSCSRWMPRSGIQTI